MYLAFFGIAEKPFAITPDPRYLYLGRHHADALAHLVYGINDAGGFIQLTGRTNYGSVQREIDARDPGSGVDLMTRSSDIETAKGGMISAMGFWSLHHLAARADRGATDAVVDTITDIVNSLTDSRPARKTNFRTITSVVFRVSECLNLARATP